MASEKAGWAEIPANCGAARLLKHFFTDDGGEDDEADGDGGNEDDDDDGNGGNDNDLDDDDDDLDDNFSCRFSSTRDRALVAATSTA